MTKSKSTKAKPSGHEVLAAKKATGAVQRITGPDAETYSQEDLQDDEIRFTGPSGQTYSCRVEFKDRTGTPAPPMPEDFKTGDDFSKYHQLLHAWNNRRYRLQQEAIRRGE